MQNLRYAPDLLEFELEGEKGIFSLITSFIVGPIRLVSRILHNIAFLPADLAKSYSNGLIAVASMMVFIGIVDLLFFGKWPVLVSQIPVCAMALRFRKKATKAISVTAEKREVHIDNDQVNAMCETTYDEMLSAVRKEMPNEY